MKSEITKRWYLVFLISVLAINSFINIYNGIRHYAMWTHNETDYWIRGVQLVMELFVWYSIIAQSSKLFVAVATWSSVNLFVGFFQLLIIIFKAHHHQNLYYTIFFSVMYLIVLIGGKKFIKISGVEEEANTIKATTEIPE